MGEVMTGYQSKKDMAQDKLAQPAQRPWVELTKEDMPDGDNPMFDHEYFIAGMVYAANILMDKNT